MLMPGASMLLKGQKAWCYVHEKRGQNPRVSTEPEDGKALGVEECS